MYLRLYRCESDSKVRRKLSFLSTMLVIIPMLCSCSCCSDLERQVRTYRGDGYIRYLKGPLLGIDGVEVNMPEVDISSVFSLDYSLAGLPVGSRYILYIVIPCSLDQQQLDGSDVSFSLKTDCSMIKELSSSLSKMTRFETADTCKLYFFGEFYFDVNKTTHDLSIAISWNAPKITEPVFVHVQVSRGGSK